MMIQNTPRGLSREVYKPESTTEITVHPEAIKHRLPAPTHIGSKRISPFPVLDACQDRACYGDIKYSRNTTCQIQPAMFSFTQDSIMYQLCHNAYVT